MEPTVSERPALFATEHHPFIGLYVLGAGGLVRDWVTRLGFSEVQAIIFDLDGTLIDFEGRAKAFPLDILSHRASHQAVFGKL